MQAQPEMISVGGRGIQKVQQPHSGKAQNYVNWSRGGRKLDRAVGDGVVSATIRTGGSGSSWILLRLGAGEICSEPMRKEVPPPISYPFSERHLEAAQGPNTLIPGHRFESPAASCTPGCFFLFAATLTLSKPVHFTAFGIPTPGEPV